MPGIRVSFWMCLVFLGLIGTIPTPAEAQLAPGVQAGVSIDPDQFYFGGHVETTPLIDQVRFRPSVDIGIGDVTSIAGNFEFTYTFPTTQPWSFFAGGGPAINWYDFDDGGSDSQAGFNLLGGVKHRGGLFFEVKIGLNGSPELKFGVGYTFM